MKKLIPLLTIIFLISCSQEMKEVDYSKIVKRNNTAYEVNSEEAFTGLVTAYHPNEQLKSKTIFVNGIKDGKYLEYRVNGSLLKALTYQKGTLLNLTSYHANGNMERYEGFKDNKIVSVQLYNEDGDDDLINAELIPLGVFYGNRETEENKYNFSNVFRYLIDLSNLEIIDKPIYLNLINEDGYIPGRVVFLSPIEGSLIPSLDPFYNLYLDENLNPIKEGKVKRESIAPAMGFYADDSKPLRTCLSRKDCTDVHNSSFYDEKSYLIEHIQDYKSVEKETYYFSGSFNYSTIFNFDKKEWMPNSKKPVSYYENGSIKTKYKFKDTKNIGRTEFYEDGVLSGDFNYIGEKNIYKIYSKYGILERETSLNESGYIEKFYYKTSGEKRSEVTIDDIEYIKTYHANGQIAEIFSKKGYSRDGSFIGYDSNGNVLLTSNIVNGDLSGECLIFSSDGQQLAKWSFNAGKTDDDGYQNSYTYLNCQYGGIFELDEELYKAFNSMLWIN